MLTEQLLAKQMVTRQLGLDWRNDSQNLTQNDRQTFKLHFLLSNVIVCKSS
jgi:hypothetical protein